MVDEPTDLLDLVELAELEDELDDDDDEEEDEDDEEELDDDESELSEMVGFRKGGVWDLMIFLSLLFVGGVSFNFLAAGLLDRVLAGLERDLCDRFWYGDRDLCFLL